MRASHPFFIAAIGVSLLSQAVLPVPLAFAESVSVVKYRYYALTVTPAALRMRAGQAKNVVLSLPFLTAKKKVTVAVKGMPKGMSYRLVMDVKKKRATVTFVTSAALKPGTYKLEVSATDANRIYRRQISVRIDPVVVPKPTPQPSQPVVTPQPVQPPVSGTTNGAPTMNSCQIFPANNPWNTDISSYPVSARSSAYISSIGSNGIHPDFGSPADYGIPITIAPENQPLVRVTFRDYGDESDPGPYPIPADARIEGGVNSDGDRHVVVLDPNRCKLYELYSAQKDSDGWSASNGAVFDLTSNALRPTGWTSADAAGLPIYPGLVKYDEVMSGHINHAIRFTAQRTQKGFIAPATHYASSNTDPNVPPMGLRVRLKANFDISSLTGQARVIAEAMKKYGMILADNGSNWYFTGETDSRWNDDDLNQLKNIPGSAFEAVDTGKVQTP